MDPLSITMAIIGLIGAAERVRRAVSPFVRKFKHAVIISETVLSEMSCMQTALVQLKAYLENEERYDHDARQYILLEQLGTMLTGCVKRFAELEKVLENLPTQEVADFSAIVRSKWARKEKQVKELVDRLQPYKLSLTLMLQILEAESTRKTSTKLIDLQKSIEALNSRMLSSDPDLAARMLSIEESTVALQSGVDAHPEQALPSEERSLSDPGPFRTLHSARPRESSRATREPLRLGDGTLLEESLQRSKVYSRLTRTVSMFTTTSTVAGTTTGSMASRISLAAISHVAVYRLPISAEELSNGQWYTSYEEQRYEHMGKVTEERHDSVTDSVSGSVTGSALSGNEAVPRRTSLPLLHRLLSRSSSGDEDNEKLHASYAPTLEVRLTFHEVERYRYAGFRGDLPVSTAICGCLLLTCDLPAADISPHYVDLDASAALCSTFETGNTLTEVTGPGTYDLFALIGALKLSLGRATGSVISPKLARPLYEKLANRNIDSPRGYRKDQESAYDLVKRLPENTLVLVLFLLRIVKRLQRNGVLLTSRAPPIFLLEDLWPSVHSRTLFPGGTSAADAASALLLEHLEYLSGRLPSEIDTVACWNRPGDAESGTRKRVNLFARLANLAGHGPRIYAAPSEPHTDSSPTRPVSGEHGILVIGTTMRPISQQDSV